MFFHTPPVKLEKIEAPVQYPTYKKVRTSGSHLPGLVYPAEFDLRHRAAGSGFHCIKGEVMILITGASGTVGRAVLNEVLKSGQRPKAMYRSAKDAEAAPEGVSTAGADFADQQSLRHAMTGVEMVYVVCSPIPQLVALECNAIEACVASGVRHVVLNSALGAEDYPKSFPAWHRQVEDRLKSSGLGYTIVRPNGFMQNILAYNAPSIRAQGAFYWAQPAPALSMCET
jgi:uncharacterized protein YbjT (DUF2867 family)